MKGAWIEQISTGSYGGFHGAIYKAARHYYYGDIYGLRRPPLNGSGPRMKIAAMFSIRKVKKFEF